MSTANTTSAQESSTTPAMGEVPLNQISVDSGNNEASIDEHSQHETQTDEQREEDNPFSSKKRQRTSKVWEDFKIVSVPSGIDKAECIHCKTQMTINKTGATSHLLRHTKHCLRKKCTKGQQHLSITTSISELEAVASVQNFKYDQAKMREIISHMIIVYELPFAFVEYKLFNLAMKTATPYYQSISRATAKNDCMASYEMEKKKVMDTLKGVNRVSVTTDLWKSDQKVSYMVVTCHYVDSNYTLQKRNLNFCDVPPPHTGVAICDALHKCLIEWGIENKVWTVTVDNASYNDVAIRMLKENLSYNNSLPLNGRLFHVRWCAHILNLLVQDGLKDIEDVVHNVRESVKHISASEVRLNMFSEIAKQLQLSSKKLVLDCCTRWNATYFMLSAALEFKAVFPRYQQRDISYMHLPSEEDWKMVRVVCSFLEEFNEVTKLISGTEYPTSNLFLAELYNIKKLLSGYDAEDDAFMINMIEKMKNKFEKYWGQCNMIISIGAALDPRYKLKFIEWCFPQIYSEVEAIEHIVNVRETLRALYNEYVESHKIDVSEKSDQGNTQSSSSSISTTSGKGKDKVRAKFSNYIKNIDSVEKVKSELEVYLDEGVVICDEDVDFDALAWWRTNNLKFRILSKMACDVLAIPITTVASESAFSACGRVIDPHCANLGVGTVQALLCGEDWLRARYGIKRKEKATAEIQEIHLA